MKAFTVVVEGAAPRPGEDPTTRRRILVTAKTEAEARKTIGKIERQLADHFGDEPWAIVELAEGEPDV